MKIILTNLGGYFPVNPQISCEPVIMYIFIVTHQLLIQCGGLNGGFLDDANKLSKKAEAKNDFKLLVSSNGLCDTKAKQMKREIPQIQKDITDLKAKL